MAHIKDHGMIESIVIDGNTLTIETDSSMRLQRFEFADDERFKVHGLVE